MPDQSFDLQPLAELKSKGEFRMPVGHRAPLGQVHDETLEPPRYVRAQVGNAMTRDTYEISVGADGCPIVQSNQTGNYFLLGWDVIIRIAIAEGIERSDLKTEPKRAKLYVPGFDITPVGG